MAGSWWRGRSPARWTVGCAGLGCPACLHWMSVQRMRTLLGDDPDRLEEGVPAPSTSSRGSSLCSVVTGAWGSPRGSAQQADTNAPKSLLDKGSCQASRDLGNGAGDGDRTHDIQLWKRIKRCEADGYDESRDAVGRPECAAASPPVPRSQGPRESQVDRRSRRRAAPWARRGASAQPLCGATSPTRRVAVRWREFDDRAARG